ncbi:MAG: hypothetical protein IJI83_03220 [Oscillospiraceae bacterium]|nr:hypothetical protein [Oscillospiraceae bacterium]
MPKADSFVYIIETNGQIRETEKIFEDGEFITVRYGYKEPHYISGGIHHLQAKGGIRIRKSRVFCSREEAEDHLKKIKEKEEQLKLVRILDSFD